MRPPKRPEALSPDPSLVNAGGELAAVLAGIKTRPSFGVDGEWEALEAGGFTVILTRFRKPVAEKLQVWAAEFLDYKVEQAPAPEGFCKAGVSRNGERFEFFVNGTQAYSAAPAGSVRELFLHPHDFVPAERRPKDAAMRVHLAGGSDQWVSPSKLAKFLASGRDGALTGLDWGQLPE